jgi:HD-like signal output (HDOD) protein
VSDLPAMPQTVFKAQELMSSSQAGMKQLAQVIETDQAIVARMLRFANSTYYGLSGKVSSVRHAATLLGNLKVGELITMAGSSTVIANTLEGYGLESGALWLHSLAVAFGARIVVSRKNPDLAGDAFTAGLLHDAGKMILGQYILEKRAKFQGIIRNGEQTFLEIEEKLLGFDHSEIMSAVCKNWNIPANLANAIQYHHCPSRTPESIFAYAVHLADAIAIMSGVGTGIDGMLYHLDEATLDFFDLSDDDIIKVMCEGVESVQKVEEERT